MKRALLSFLIFLTSCSSDQSLQDDWPGIDDMNLETPATDDYKVLAQDKQSFRLHSFLKMPTAGKDVKLTLTATCKRKPTAGLSLRYAKTSHPEANSKVFVIDALPEEMLIYPEFFESCSFELLALNQNFSSSEKKLQDQKFIFEASDSKIKVTTFDLKPGETRFTIPKEFSRNLTLSLEDLDQSIKLTKFACFSKTPYTQELQSSYQKVIEKPDFSLPIRINENPLEHCVFVAEGSSGAKFISSRLKFLNRDELKNPWSVSDFESEASTYQTPNGDIQIPYFKSHDAEYKLFSFRIKNLSPSENRSFRLRRGKVLDQILIVDKLLNTGSQGLTDYYSLHTQEMETYYEWRSQAGKSLPVKISLSPGSTYRLGLYVQPSFLCPSTQDSIHPYELGFITAVDKKSPLLQIQEVSENIFLSDVIDSANIIEVADRPLFLNSSLPQGSNPEIAAQSSFQLFFRNQHSFSGKNLYLYYNRKAFHPGPNMENPVGADAYDFQTAVYREPNSCIQHSEKDD